MLPDLPAHWIAPLLPGGIPGETHATVDAIASESATRLSDGILRKLLDFGLLRKA